MTPSRKIVFDAMNKCIKNGRYYQKIDPSRSMEEIEKLKIIHEIFETVTIFENKLVTDLDVD